MWKESVYNVHVQTDDGVLIYNTLTDRFIVIHESMSNLISKFPRLESVLRQKQFLVDRSSTVRDEYGEFFACRDRPSKSMYVLLTTTTDCNLACGYCFENREGRLTMSAETLDRTLTWMSDYIRNNDVDALTITLFGGEPMLDVPLAERALTSIGSICKELGVKLNPVLMTTNGLHNDEEQLLRLKKAGITDIQITFDGDAAANNSRRKPRKFYFNQPLNSEEKLDPYSSIMKNLRLYVSNFDVVIKINFDKTTVSSVSKLLTDLELVAGLKNSDFRVKIEPIAQSRSDMSKSVASALYDPTKSEMAHAFDEILETLRYRGIRADMSAVFPTPCMVSSPNSFLLEPSGSLRSCISAFGMEQFDVGDVSTGVNSKNDRRNVATSSETRELDSCIERSCAYLPVCDGGCKYELALSGKAPSEMQCKFDYFEVVVPMFAKNKLVDAPRVEHFGI